jgi:phosphoacetylglucosamine mutase
VGDAISDMLLVEVILRNKEWTMDKWLHMYEDLPSRLLKVKVTDTLQMACKCCFCLTDIV